MGPHTVLMWNMHILLVLVNPIGSEHIVRIKLWYGVKQHEISKQCEMLYHSYLHWGYHTTWWCTDGGLLKSPLPLINAWYHKGVRQCKEINPTLMRCQDQILNKWMDWCHERLKGKTWDRRVQFICSSVPVPTLRLTTLHGGVMVSIHTDCDNSDNMTKSADNDGLKCTLGTTTVVSV